MSGSFEVPLERIEDSFDIASQVFETVEDAFSVRGGRFVEHYAEAKFSLHVKYSLRLRKPWAFPGNTELRHFHAIYESPNIVRPKWLDLKKLMELRRGHSRSLGIAKREGSGDRVIRGQSYGAMLVSVPEFIQQPQPMSLILLPALEWLFCLELGNEFLVNEPELTSLGSVPILGVRTGDYRERGESPGRIVRKLAAGGKRFDGLSKTPLVMNGEFPYQLVQGAPEVMDDIPDEGSPSNHRQRLEPHNMDANVLGNAHRRDNMAWFARRQVAIDLQPQSGSIGGANFNLTDFYRVCLDNESIGVVCQERPEGFVEMINVRVGPPYLLARSGQGSISHSGLAHDG